MKKVRVIFEGEGKEDYLKLLKTVEQEKKNGITSSEHITLLNSINQKVELLKSNPQAERAIQKKLIKKLYQEKKIKNLYVKRNQHTLKSNDGISNYFKWKQSQFMI